jgi:hypothetical protein
VLATALPNALDIADRSSKSLSEGGLYWVVGVSLGVSAVLFVLFMWKVHQNSALMREMLTQEQRLRTEVDKVRREHMDSLVQLSGTAHALVRLNEKVQSQADSLEAERESFERERRSFRGKRGAVEPATLTVVEKK